MNDTPSTTHRGARKRLHKKGLYPPVYPAVFTRRRLGDPPGLYGARDNPRAINAILPATVARTRFER